ncbi:MAG: stage V sporulation protein AA [Clostridiales bacterium]|jgi:stage V sporulation protein AA|nr:stage V sporulation protein AA [Clostridiales bacterium]MDR2750869.1 stage V sporulation protein AA [Clostridiales bacterium]
MDVYIKPSEKVAENEKKVVKLDDICEIVAPTKILEKLKKLEVVRIEAEKERNYLIDITDIIRLIQKVAPDATINNVGAKSTVIAYNPQLKKQNPVIKVILIGFVSLVLMAGSATAIMSFHTDAQIPQIFKNYHRLFFGEETEKPVLIYVSYSIGLASGIIIFFNHFFGKKIMDDPTPIDVEMTLYDHDVTETIVELLSDKDKQNPSEKEMGESHGLK